MIYKVEVKEPNSFFGRTWDTYHIRAKDFDALLIKINKKLEKSRIKLVVKSIEETNLKVS